MSVAVVDLLEVVDIEHDEREHAAVPHRAVQLALDRLEEVALIEALDDQDDVDDIYVNVIL